MIALEGKTGIQTRRGLQGHTCSKEANGSQSCLVPRQPLTPSMSPAPPRHLREGPPQVLGSTQGCQLQSQSSKGKGPLVVILPCPLSLSRKDPSPVSFRDLQQPHSPPLFSLGFPAPHLQWMTMGPASGGVEAFTRRMKASSPVAW